MNLIAFLVSSEYVLRSGGMPIPYAGTVLFPKKAPPEDRMFEHSECSLEYTKTCLIRWGAGDYSTKRYDQCLAGKGLEKGKIAGSLTWCNDNKDCKDVDTCVASQKCNQGDIRYVGRDEMKDFRDERWLNFLKDDNLDLEKHNNALSSELNWVCYECLCHIWDIRKAPVTDRGWEGTSHPPECLAGYGPFDAIFCGKRDKEGAKRCAAIFNETVKNKTSNHVRCLYPSQYEAEHTKLFAMIRNRIRNNDFPQNTTVESWSETSPAGQTVQPTPAALEPSKPSQPRNETPKPGQPSETPTQPGTLPPKESPFEAPTQAGYALIAGAITVALVMAVVYITVIARRRCTNEHQGRPPQGENAMFGTKEAKRDQQFQINPKRDVDDWTKEPVDQNAEIARMDEVIHAIANAGPLTTEEKIAIKELTSKKGKKANRLAKLRQKSGIGKAVQNETPK